MASTFVRGFIPGNVGRILVLFTKLIAQAERNRNPAIARALRREQLLFVEEMEGLAVITSRAADRAIKARLNATQRRPDTGNPNGLERHILSTPVKVAGFRIGAIGVANVELLNALRNPRARNDGTYWRAQEYGTGAGDSDSGITVPSQVGRNIFGLFTGGGGSPERPKAIYRGGGGPHPIFVPTKGRSNVAAVRGGRGGPGTITVEITGRHYIRDGANIALAEWTAGLRRVEQRTSKRLAALALTGGGPAVNRRGRIPRPRPRPGRR